MANVAVLPKQQVQIRASLVARSMPLGLLDETQVDEWVKAQQLDELTFTSANTSTSTSRNSSSSNRGNSTTTVQRHPQNHQHQH